MNLDRLYEILRETTVQLRKGEEIEGDPELVGAIKNFKEGDNPDDLPGGVVHVYAMPHESQAKPEIEKVDCHFLVIGVDKELAERHRAEFISILKEYPEPDRLAAGPSYIEVGAAIGDQGSAFQLFALGKALGLWTVITPKLFGMTGPQADQAAGNGFVMMSGFKTA